jgi:hypothetical protein
MTDLWNLLPPGVVKWAKAILAAVAAVLNILFTTVPALEGGRWAVWVVSVLAVIAVAVTPNSNAQSRMQQLAAEKTLHPPFAGLPQTGTFGSGSSTVSDFTVEYRGDQPPA